MLHNLYARIPARIYVATAVAVGAILALADSCSSYTVTK